MDPQFTVTLNRKDAGRYMRLYPSIILYFWVDWPEETRYGVAIKETRGVWVASMRKLAPMLLHTAPIHAYQQRVGDKVNATQSYLIDIREITKVP